MTFRCTPVVLLAVALLTACGDRSAENGVIHTAVDTTRVEITVPRGFPQPHIPADNPLTKARIALGRKLFFDPVLSADSSISCASCHKPANAFSDVVALSAGVEGQHTDRNSPSLLNVAFHPYLMREGGSRNLELQILVPLESPNEMNLLIGEACERLNSLPEYRELFTEAFGTRATPYTLTRALASFERTLVSANTPYDRFARGDSTALDALAITGFSLFNSDRLACGKCHSGMLFTDFSFRNNGLYAEYKDGGRRRLTLLPEDEGKFKVPTLRNITLTGPYMHDGSLETLEEVLDHYAEGGKGHRNQDSLVRPLHLLPGEKEAVIAFLKSLTDDPQAR